VNKQAVPGSWLCHRVLLRANFSGAFTCSREAARVPCLTSSAAACCGYARAEALLSTCTQCACAESGSVKHSAGKTVAPSSSTHCWVRLSSGRSSHSFAWNVTECGTQKPTSPASLSLSTRCRVCA
jgi:hypothetical protein